MDIDWQRPRADDAAARLSPAEPQAACVVLRVPVAALDRVWQRSAVDADRLPDVTTTAASITFGRTLATLQRTRRASTPLVRYATTPRRGGALREGEIEFIDGRDAFAAAMALGAAEVEIVVPAAEAQRFLDDVGGSRVETLAAHG